MYYYLSQGGTGVPCPPLASFTTHIVLALPLFYSLVTRACLGLECLGGDLVVCLFVLEGGKDGEKWDLVIWGPYQKSFSPAPSSHWCRCTLIRCAGTQDPPRQR